MNQLSIQENTRTMSSLEIAEITGKRHSDVLRDIDVMLKSLDADLRSGLKTTSYKDASGKSNRSFELDKDSSLCLMSGYDTNARMKIIKRWRELEKAAQLPVASKPILPPETQLLVDQIYQIHELTNCIVAKRAKTFNRWRVVSKSWILAING